MPDLPEIEVARRDMEREVAGKKLKAVEHVDKALLGHQKVKADFAKRLVGHKVKSFDRRGTYVVGKLDSGDFWVIDLGSGGHMVKVKGNKPEATKATRLTVSFTTGGAVRLNDSRGGAQSWVVSKEELDELSEAAATSVDPLEKPVPWQEFGRFLREHRRSKLKALLQNPKVVVGLGAVYSDEVLFNAGLRYDRAPESLSAHEVRRLYRGMVETLSDAIKYRGVSFEDDEVDMYGEPGEYGSHLQVFGRFQEPCRRCRAPIERVKFQKRYHFYCENCQS